MKTKRHEKILEIISKEPIETQEELAKALNQLGFQVTQATVSRDIRDLKLTKVPDGETGRQKYANIHKPDMTTNTKYLRVLKDGFVSMDHAQNILVIKTVSGMAMAVAAALDALEMHEIVGCIAGDDTVMCAIRSNNETLAVMNEIRRLLSI